MKGRFEYNDVNLDWKAREVLFVIKAADGKSDTSEVRQATGFHAEIIKYRFEKLEDAGLIEVGTPERLPDGRMGAKPVEITAEGEQVVRKGFDTDSESTLEERLRRIERRSERYKDLREAYQDEQNKVEKFQEQVEELESRVKSLEDWISLDNHTS